MRYFFAFSNSIPIICGSNSSDLIRSRPPILRYDRNGHPVLLGFLMNSTCNFQKDFPGGKRSRTSQYSKNGLCRRHIRISSLSAPDIRRELAISASSTQILTTGPATKVPLTVNSRNSDHKQHRWTIVIISISVAGTVAFIIILILLLVLCLRRGQNAVTNEEKNDHRNQYQFESLKIPSQEHSTSTLGTW